jgi:VanZ family protein
MRKQQSINQHDLINRWLFARLAVVYLFIIVYGSLLPFNVNNLTVADAWISFQQVPLRILGPGSRADLVANLLLYIPFGFLVCGWLIGQSRRSLVITMGVVLSLIFTAVSVLSIEFTQQFFPPRTVSQNDILAEFAGSIIGIGLWLVKGPHCISLFKAFSSGGVNTRHALLVVYTLVYLGLSLFPYDFLLSADEWRMKMASGMAGWWFIPGCGVGCMWKMIPEILLVAPIAVLIFASRPNSPLWIVLLVGAILGSLIEVLQLTIVSGISQGASIMPRIIGMLLGVVLLRIVPRLNWQVIRRGIPTLLLLSIIPYLIALTWANGWFSGDWLSFAEGLSRLPDIYFLPFYYHYYSTETVALVSLLFQTALYLPVGAGLWLWHWSRSTDRWEGGHIWSACLGAILAILVESGKLFVSGLRPDPTDILIAMVTASVVYQLLNLMFLITPNTTIVRMPQQHDKSMSSGEGLNGVGIIGILSLCVATLAAISSPLGAMWVTLPLVIYAALLWWRPSWWLVWILALLPLLDFTPWTGRLFWTEYDTLLLTTIGICYLRLHASLRVQTILNFPAKILLTLFVISTAISLGVGLFPLESIDQNAFSNYFSSYNALRTVKALLFALAFIPLLAYEWTEPTSAARRVALGFSLALVFEVFYVLWERATFGELFNFETDYRITGSFSGMHTGGAYIEGFLVMALPFVVLWAWQQRSIWITILAIGLYSLGAYSIMVTFSRAGQVAFLLVTFIVMFGFMRLALRNNARRFIAVGVVTLIVGVAISLAVAWPVFSGKYSQARLATTGQDIITRTDHWADAFNIVLGRDASVFGVGLGSFPSAFFWDSSLPMRSATYSFATENENTFLQLGSGESLYFEQPVAIDPEQYYTLSMLLRSHAEKASLTTPICEKALLYSYTCAWVALQINAPVGEWARYETQMFTKNFGPPGSQIQRPVKLSLYNMRAGTTMDIDNVMLKDSSGNNLVRNGDFSDGMHHWFFSTDSHLSWHIKNLYLHVFFEQGWFGFICFMALVGYTLIRLLSHARHNDALGLTIFASLIPFLAVGMVDSLVDETRIGFLFYLLLITGLVADRRFVPLAHRQPEMQQSD